MTAPEEAPAKPFDQVKGHCPTCGPDRYADVVRHFHARYSDDEDGIWETKDYRILRCGGCKAVYFQETSIFSEDRDYYHHPVTGETMGRYNERVTFWPAPTKRVRPEWYNDVQVIDVTLYGLLRELYDALDSDSRILASIGVRTAFDRTSELLGVHTSLRFDEKLGELMAKGKIGDGEKVHLDALTDAGNAAAHRAWNPKIEELSTMMNILENFIYRTLILDQQVAKLKPAIPPKPPRPPKMP